MKYKNHYVVWHNNNERFQNGFTNVYTEKDKAGVIKEFMEDGYVPTVVNLISTDWTTERYYRVTFADEKDPSMVLYFYSYTELMNHLATMFANCGRPIEIVEITEDHSERHQVFVQDKASMYVREQND